ncbi:hypothetical protein D083_1597 [Dickeya solani RNS 08.23.3.1.A]|nr:hypothetical protein D083_1597 [Dickeya solani RNS 08.23.3.1.A]
MRPVTLFRSPRFSFLIDTTTPCDQNGKKRRFREMTPNSLGDCNNPRW